MITPFLSYLSRFNKNIGTGFNTTPTMINIQSNTRILIGGYFTNLNGTTRNYFVRLYSNGLVDTAFYSNLGTGFDSNVDHTIIQSDRKIVCGGLFNHLNGNVRLRILRLNENGTEDTAFYTNLGTSTNSGTTTLAIQSTGKILVGGGFTTFNGNTRTRLIRLNSDGTEDSAFYTNLGTSIDGMPYAETVQSNDQILIGGAFTHFNTNLRNRLIRLNSDGTEDTAFYANLGTSFDNSVGTVMLRPNGKILVGGAFANFNGSACPELKVNLIFS